MKRIGKRCGVLAYLKHAMIGCVLAIGVCAVAFAADPTQVIGNEFGGQDTAAIIANVTASDVEALKPYMEDEFIQRVECKRVNCTPDEFLSAYLQEDETFIFTIQKYLDNSLV